MAKGDIDFSNFGRPPKYTNVEDMEAKIVEYFEQSKNASGKYQPTIEGLTFHLGFSSRQSMIDYANKAEFMDVVNRAKLFIKSCYEKQLYGFAWAGAQFALRNIGKEDWKDEITEHQDRRVENVTITEKKRDE